jgi:hypothetical protein
LRLALLLYFLLLRSVLQLRLSLLLLEALRLALLLFFVLLRHALLLLVLLLLLEAQRHAPLLVFILRSAFPLHCRIVSRTVRLDLRLALLGYGLKIPKSQRNRYV